jgi:hypothetical protein
MANKDSRQPAGKNDDPHAIIVFEIDQAGDRLRDPIGG